MKKHLTKLVLLLAFTSVVISSCSLQYRQRGTYRHSTPYNNNDNGHRPAMHRYQSLY